MTRKQILEAAEKCVNGDRDQKYGAPEDNFSEIAELWSIYLDSDIVASDVAIMMMLMKIARLKSSLHEDNDSWVDIAGYAACGGEIATRNLHDNDGFICEAK